MNAKNYSPGTAGQPVIVDHSATTTVATTQAGAAKAVAARSAAERFDTGAMVPTFGLIGAGFLGALGRVQNARTSTLDTLAANHAATSTCATAAQTSYDCCDAATTTALQGVPA